MYREPLGGIGAITPWNLPFSLAMGAITPALAGGNAVDTKPSEYTPMTVLGIARAFADRIVFVGSVTVGLSIGRALADAAAAGGAASTGRTRCGN